MLSLLATLLLSLAPYASSHGGCANYTVGDVWYPGYDAYGTSEQDTAPWQVQRKWISNNPIFEADNVSLACNFPGNSANTYIPIRAGQNISAIYYYWVHTIGPMVAWMTDCHGDCKTVNTTKADWFKIGEKGLASGNLAEGNWFQKTFSTWDGGPSFWNETIPASLKPGKYLIRHEIISLHSANKPQWYPECAHLEVSGSGTSFPGQQYMAKIPGVYNMSQPEINIDVYSLANQNVTTYKIPGPPVWAGQ